MTSQQAEESRLPTEVLDEDQIAAYLEAHPDFFERHLDLVANLEVPHASGRAVSLIERQVEVLRGQLKSERQRLSHLIARARDFEDLSARLHGLTLHLIAAQDPKRLQTVLHETLCREFDASAVMLKLFRLESDTADPDPTLSAFSEFIDREHSLCGPLDEDHNAVLFGEQGETIRSAALIPVRADGRCGVLAIGSEDPERFGADMGTDLLDRLGEIVSHKLRSLHEADV
jgi:uncharacterized protein YigA (DUF484 family)